MELKLLQDNGQIGAGVAASAEVFGRDYNEALVHQIVVAYQANARSGNRKQKDREEVKHTTKKPWRQKGTGRARAGMSFSPEEYGLCSCRHVVLAPVAWRWPYLPEFAGRELQPEGQQEDVPCRYALDLLAART